MVVISCTIYDNQHNTEKILWFRGKTIVEAARRRDEYMRKHPHSEIVSQFLI